jgi:hypothetical protein
MRILGLMLLAVAVVCGSAGAQQRIAQRRPLTADGYIKIYNMAGSIRIVGWDRDTVAVTGSVDGQAGRFFLHTDGRAGKLGVEGQGEGRAELEIRVPRRSTVWVKTSSAEIEVSGVSGALDLYSVNGPIRVRGQMRQVYAESMGGNVDLDVSAPSIRAKNGSGSVVVRGSGDDVSLSTVDGSMRISGAHLQRGRFESISGDILYEGAVERGGSTTFQSHSGSVELRLPARSSVDFALSTYEGDIRSDFRIQDSARDRGPRGRELTFSNGSGGADVSVRTYSGPIILHKAP